MIFHKISFFI